MLISLMKGVTPKFSCNNKNKWLSSVTKKNASQCLFWRDNAIMPYMCMLTIRPQK